VALALIPPGLDCLYLRNKMTSWRINQVIDPPFSFKTASGPGNRDAVFLFPKQIN